MKLKRIKKKVIKKIKEREGGGEESTPAHEQKSKGNAKAESSLNYS